MVLEAIHEMMVTEHSDSVYLRSTTDFFCATKLGGRVAIYEL